MIAKPFLKFGTFLIVALSWKIIIGQNPFNLLTRRWNIPAHEGKNANGQRDYKRRHNYGFYSFHVTFIQLRLPAKSQALTDWGKMGELNINARPKPPLSDPSMGIWRKLEVRSWKIEVIFPTSTRIAEELP